MWENLAPSCSVPPGHELAFCPACPRRTRSPPLSLVVARSVTDRPRGVTALGSKSPGFYLITAPRGRGSDAGDLNMPKGGGEALL